MLSKERRIRILFGIIGSLAITFVLVRTLFPKATPEPSIAFLSDLPSIQLPKIVSVSNVSVQINPSPYFDQAARTPTSPNASPTQPPGNLPSNTPVPEDTSIPTKTPTQKPLPSPTPTPRQNATTLCGQSPTYIPDWGADAPYSEVCVYDAAMKPVAMKQLCRAVCKSDNCTESICVAYGSYGKFNRGSKHGGYDGYGFKISKEDSQGKIRSVLEVRPNTPGQLKDCVTISGKCYLWDYWLSGAKSASVIVSSPQ